MITINKEINVEVNIDPSDFETDKLLDELEYRGYSVRAPDELIRHYEDHILSLKEDFFSYKDGVMSNESFEKVLKQFFLDTIDEYIK